MTESVTITIRKDVLERLITSGALAQGEYELKYVEVKGYDYSGNPLWISAKKESDKSYKLLKEIEFKIRNR